MSELSQKNFTIFGLILPALGYLFVAMICIMSGNSIHEPNLTFLKFIAISPEQFFYWLLLVPIFVLRVIMYEQESEKQISNVHDEWRTISIQLPFTILIFCVFLFIFYSFILGSNGLSSYSIFSDWEKLTCILLCVAPIYIQTLISWYKWRNQKGLEHFTFQYYLFFPALSTVMISFLIGWSNFESTHNLYITIISILIYYGLAIVIKKEVYKIQIAHWLMLSLVLLAFVYCFGITIPFKITVHSSDIVNFIYIFLISVMMTLIMGITETWWFIKDESNVLKYKDRIEDFEFYKKGLNTAVAVFPLAIPLSIFYPQTNQYFISILVYALLLCCVWFYGQQIRVFYWWWLRFLFGAALPVLMALSLRESTEVLLPISSTPVISVIAYLGILLAIASFFSSTDMKTEINNLFNPQKRIVACIGMAALLIMGVAPQFFSTHFDPKIYQKMNLLTLFYFIILLLFCGEILIRVLFTKKIT